MLPHGYSVREEMCQPKTFFWRWWQWGIDQLNTLAQPWVNKVQLAITSFSVSYHWNYRIPQKRLSCCLMQAVGHVKINYRGAVLFWASPRAKQLFWREPCWHEMTSWGGFWRWSQEVVMRKNLKNRPVRWWWKMAALLFFFLCCCPTLYFQFYSFETLVRE